MSLILEGPDGSGKSTLAHMLVEKYGYRSVHHGLYPDDSSGVLFLRYAMALLEADVTPTVIDRCFYSEMIYGQVMRNHDRLGAYGCALLARLANARNINQITCLPPWGVVQENWAEKRREKYDPAKGKGDYVDAEERIHSIYNLYAEISSLFYDYTRDSPEQLVGLLGFRRRSFPSWMIGTPGARFLIVGEQVNLKRNFHALPFFDLGRSSRYLTEALWSAGYREPEMAFINAISPKGMTYDLQAAASRCGRFVTAVAFGEIAAKACKHFNVPFVKVPHPAYWRRFEEPRTNDYIQMLKEIYENPSGKLLPSLVSTSTKSNGAGRSRRPSWPARPGDHRNPAGRRKVTPKRNRSSKPKS